MNGIEPAAKSLPPTPQEQDMDIVRVVSKLIKLHPPNPHHEIQFPEVVAAVNFYELEDTKEAVESVIDIIHEINLRRSTQKTPERQEYMQ